MTGSHPPKDLLESMVEPDTSGPTEGRDGPGLDPAAEARLRAWLRDRVAELPAQRARRTARMRYSAVAVAAAAAIVVMVLPRWDEPAQDKGAEVRAWQVRPVEGGTLTWFDDDGTPHHVRQARVVAAPGKLQTDDAASAELVTPQGVQLRMGPRTRLRPLATADAGFRTEVGLDDGHVDVQVPPLGKRGSRRRSFAVRTHDSEVIVHGTRFRVALRDARGIRRTCVRVFEGLVEVRGPAGSRMLRAGDALGCAEREPAPEVRPARPSEAARRAAAKRRGDLRGRRDSVRKLYDREVDDLAAPQAEAPQPALTPGRLQEQNRLLSEALVAERNGELDAAERAFRRLLREHPTSPLLPDARRGLQRVAGRPAD
ncbi:MAG: FecR family protein [Myxococcales bacterium]|nr:FecR family protein [Myxococcales bacterium]